MIARCEEMIVQREIENSIKGYRLPYISHHEYFEYKGKHELHAITVLDGGWEVKGSQFEETVFYTKTFSIQDYDISKDYLIDVQKLKKELTVWINGEELAHLDHGICQITHMIRPENNLIIVHTQSYDDIVEIRQQLNGLMIIERANDRIDDFEVQSKYMFRNQELYIQLKITDIEGAPIPTYTVMCSEGNIIATGDIHLDEVNEMICPQRSEFERGYLLFIDTEDETLVHTIA
ncbi:hypothetical protein MUA26_09535 [Staphylococcus sp. IVB6246]|uniref:hypothetical protein n=1 Tax=Staphylococcus sp. IVB6246 TaxID=2989772 RepID=UPI0021D20D55|nr:hypothetical protein [Staphylococcus sp. IVB6246]UXR69351.1 hypothetical protein MUA26_09535 [Staphylococcus sp. IVB6246]